MGSLDKIEHVVVLMLENRSFDCLLGRLYVGRDDFDGLKGNETNRAPDGTEIQVWNNAGTDPKTMSIPDPDPGELWVEMNRQLFGTLTVPNPPVATMNGFVASYVAQAAKEGGVYDPKNVMHYFVPEQVPVISRLAREFAVCDRWFASAPCQTWPNRFFVHAATAGGHENNQPLSLPFPYPMETIYRRFALAGRDDWKIYYHDIAQSHTLADLLLFADHFQFINTFRDDARAGTLPAYSFIEPRYFPLLDDLPNDQHPPHNVALAEQLISDVYNWLRSGPQWTSTLLVITYDEHGGCFDHVPPPAAVPPSATRTTPFNFDRYGVRVPAVIVSPYVAPGTIMRPPGAVPFDHTSIIATLRRRWPQLGGPLTARDAVAPDLDAVLSLAQPDNRGPEQIVAPRATPSPTEVAQAQTMPLNGMQRALVNLAANLPNTIGAVNFESAVAGQLAELHADGLKQVPLGVDTSHAGAAVDFIRRQMSGFFHGL